MSDLISKLRNAYGNYNNKDISLAKTDELDSLACSHIEDLEIEIQKLKQAYNILMKDASFALTYMESCGYQALEGWEPDFQMYRSLRQAIKKAQEVLK